LIEKYKTRVIGKKPYKKKILEKTMIPPMYTISNILHYTTNQDEVSKNNKT